MLAIDDKEDPAFKRALRRQGCEADVKHPETVAPEDVQDRHVIVIDEYLELWPEVHGLDVPITRSPRDGLAVAATLRTFLDVQAEAAEQRRQIGESSQSSRPTAFVIRTGNLARLAAGLNARAGQHLVAAQHDVEWVLPRARQAQDPAAEVRVALLAKAVSDLPTSWLAEEDADEQTLRWLGLEDQPFFSAAAEQARPPLSSLAEHTAGRSVLRWFLQRVLPYPTFLLDEMRAAALLRVAPRTLRALMGDEVQASVFDGVTYRGALADFDGPRYWRAGLQALLMRARVEYDAGPRDALSALTGTQVIGLREGDPVVTIDESQRSAFVKEASECVRVRPDAWPAYADDAWVTVDEAVASRALRHQVIAADRWRLAEQRSTDPEE